MSAQHTPGPWRALPEEPGVGYIRIRGTRLGRLYKVANVPLPSAPDDPAIDEARANARALAALPELLEALQIALAAMLKVGGDAAMTPGYFDELAAPIDAARAAIAKARQP